MRPGLTGMAHVAARFWLQKGRLMPREEAVRLVAQLVWRGVAGFPRIHEDDDEPERQVTDLTGLSATAGHAAAALDPVGSQIRPS